MCKNKNDKPMFYVWPGQPQPCETFPIRIRTILSPSNGETKPQRENHQTVAVKDILCMAWSQIRAAAWTQSLVIAMRATPRSLTQERHMKKVI